MPNYENKYIRALEWCFRCVDLAHVALQLNPEEQRHRSTGRALLLCGSGPRGTAVESRRTNTLEHCNGASAVWSEPESAPGPRTSRAGAALKSGGSAKLMSLMFCCCCGSGPRCAMRKIWILNINLDCGLQDIERKKEREERRTSHNYMNHA